MIFLICITQGATVIGHSHEQENIDVNGFDKAGSFVLEMVYTYETTVQQLGALADVSTECKQFVKVSEALVRDSCQDSFP